MSSISNLIQAGQDTIINKRYALAAFTIFFYDHLLTLGDEIKYVWSGKKSWVFWFFIANRYFPMTYQFWLLATSFGPYYNTKLCEKTSWYPLFVFVVCTLFAQVVLTLRIYAVTMKNVPIVVGFTVITVSQFMLGMCDTIRAALSGAEMDPLIPYDAYHRCRFARDRTLAIAFTGISLLYDSLAFLLIVFLATRSNREMAGIKFKIPSILQNIAADSTRYFLVIFTSHIVFVMTLAFARRSIQFLPGFGHIVFLPVMISRLMLSLKKAADPQRGERSYGINLTTIRFAGSRSGANATREGDIAPDSHPGLQTAARF